MESIYPEVFRIYTLLALSSTGTPVAQSIPVIPLCPYTRRRSVLCQAVWQLC